MKEILNSRDLFLPLIENSSLLFKLFRVLLRDEPPTAQLSRLWKNRRYIENQDYIVADLALPEQLLSSLSSLGLLSALGTIIYYTDRIPNFAYQVLPHSYWCTYSLYRLRREKIDKSKIDDKQCKCLLSADHETTIMIAHPELLQEIQYTKYDPVRVLQEAKLTSKQIRCVLRDFSGSEVVSYCIANKLIDPSKPKYLRTILSYPVLKSSWCVVPKPLQESFEILSDKITDEVLLTTLFHCHDLSTIPVYSFFLKKLRRFEPEYLVKRMLANILRDMRCEPQQIFTSVEARIMGSPLYTVICSLLRHGCEWSRELARSLCEQGLEFREAYSAFCSKVDIAPLHFVDCSKSECVKLRGNPSETHMKEFNMNKMIEILLKIGR